MQKLFRTMRADGVVPALGRSARTLGVRAGVDIQVDDRGFVDPKTGGMSVAPDDPMNLPPARKPRAMGGNSKDPLWVLEQHGFAGRLAYSADSLTHGVIEPSERLLLEEYEGELGATQASWSMVS